MNENISSVLDGFKQRLTNPFIGTVILVVLMKYWDIWYAVFTFDDDCDMLYKKTYIYNYFVQLNFWWEIGCIVSRAFIALTVTYILLAFSRLMLEIYDKQMIKRAIKLADKNSIKTLAEYQALESNYSELFEKTKRVNTENETLEQKNGFFRSEISDKTQKITELNVQVGMLHAQNEGLTNELKNYDAEFLGLRERNSNLDNDIKALKSDNSSFVSLNIEYRRRAVDAEHLVFVARAFMYDISSDSIDAQKVFDNINEEIEFRISYKEYPKAIFEKFLFLDLLFIYMLNDSEYEKLVPTDSIILLIDYGLILPDDSFDGRKGIPADRIAFTSKGGELISIMLKDQKFNNKF